MAVAEAVPVALACDPEDPGSIPDGAVCCYCFLRQGTLPHCYSQSNYIFRECEATLIVGAPIWVPGRLSCQFLLLSTNMLNIAILFLIKIMTCKNPFLLHTQSNQLPSAIAEGNELSNDENTAEDYESDEVNHYNYI